MPTLDALTRAKVPAGFLEARSPNFRELEPAWLRQVEGLRRVA
jgi:hypothetical protein